MLLPCTRAKQTVCMKSRGAEFTIVALYREVQLYIFSASGPVHLFFVMTKLMEWSSNIFSPQSYDSLMDC